MSELAIGNFTSCCRLCLSDKVDALKPLFGVSVDDKTLPEKISAFVEVKVTSNDKITTMICNQCIIVVNTWQVFKKSCGDNQGKLKNWLQLWVTQQELADVSLQIKEEPLDETIRLGEHTVEIDDDAEQDPLSISTVMVKAEPVDNDEQEVPQHPEVNELPPELTRFDCDGQMNTEEQSVITNHVSDEIDVNKLCKICNKTFSTISNRRKHERVMHGTAKQTGEFENHKGELPEDDGSQNSIESQTDREVATVNASQKAIEPTKEKIQFAAGLKLFQNSTPPISHENLSKIEVSYAEKCKAMVGMYKTLICACHNVQHPNLKGLLSHLRALRIWFPVFTCYNCMITFTDRSSHYKHNSRCPRAPLETLSTLSNLRKRSEVKTRLYQNYQCTKCKFMYSFHDDFTKHVDEEHVPEDDEDKPYRCLCKKEFTEVVDYKEHIYHSCYVYFYCDICFVTTNTVDEFQKHASEVHDNSEGFVLLQDDNYKKRKPIEKHETDENLITTGKRKSTFYNKLVIEPEDEFGTPPPKKSNVSPSTKPTICPVCSKQYSTYANMMRHYRSHAESGFQNGEEYEQEDSLYCCPDCRGMFTAEEWESHKESHEKCTCSECGKLFQFQSELDQHRSVHLNLKLYRDSKTSTYKSQMLSPNSEQTVIVLCEVCDAIFKSKEELKEHKLIHENNVIKTEIQIKKEVLDDEEKRYQCIPCNKVYSGYSGLWEHNRKKHPEATMSTNFPKKCNECDKVLNTGGSWYMHKQMHERIAQTIAGNSPVPQPKPTRAKRSNVDGDEDDNGNDEDESYFTCKRCFKVFSTKYNLKNHMKCHGINLASTTKANTKSKSHKKVWCDVCHVSCDSNEALKKHKEEEHSQQLSNDEPEVDPMFELKNPFIFTCDVCTRTFTTKIALKKHKERHTQEEEMPVVKKPVYVYCKYCKIPFATVDLLNNHMVSEHNEESAKQKAQQQQQPQKLKQFACNVCKKAFISAAALYAHQGWHKRGKVEKQIKTQEKLFRKMVTNLAKPQTQTVQFQCSTCLVQLPNDTALQIHILEKHRNVNTVILPPKCQPCNQDFTSQEEYEHHKRLHEVVEKQQKFNKGFPCKFCPAAFSRSDTLNTHVRTIHKEHVQDDYRCNHCDRTFDKQMSLSIHLKVHEKQKGSVASSKPLFSCSICNMGFDLPKDLRAHTIKAHPF